MPSIKPVKVFGIGFHKTGTSSLGLGLRTLGYTVTGPNFINDGDLRENLLTKALAVAREHDAFQDNPWPILFKEMDAHFPGSKFILTVREPQSWLRSALSFWGNRETAMRRHIYGFGCPVRHEAAYLKRYLQHYEEVQRYFAERPKDLLVFDLVGSARWEPLCAFLDCAVPTVEFPRIKPRDQSRN